MGNPKVGNPANGSLEGRTFWPVDLSELIQAVDKAFDYRGDVTLELRSGERVKGYIFNRNAEATLPHLQMYLMGQAAPRLIPYSEIVTVSFTGEDTALGKSWESWVKKKESERKAQAVRVEADARARGHL